MEDPLNTALVVTGIGMLVLFLALAFLYGLIYLLTEITTDRPEAGAEEGAKTVARERRRQAAVIAVALARAEQELGATAVSEANAAAGRWRVSPWRAHHHQRQLTRNLRRKRAR